MMQKLLSLLVLTLIPTYGQAGSSLPADISYVTVDLKYSLEDGVKICEMQQGVNSPVTGQIELTGSSDLAWAEVSAHFKRFEGPIWYTPYLIAYINRGAQNEGWIRANYSGLKRHSPFRSRAKRSVQAPDQINSYHGLVLSMHTEIPSPSKFRAKYPGILLLNAPFLMHFGSKSNRISNKSKMNALFDGNPLSEAIRPNWGLYKTKTPRLAATILKDLDSDLLVIKPLRGNQCKGVIILKRKDLAETLDYILLHKKRCKKDQRPEYRYWAKYKEKEFIVEEFAKSDPIIVPVKSGDEYDATMRVACGLSCDHGVPSLTILYCGWKLPEKPLGARGSLNDKYISHRHTPPHWAEVDETTRALVQEELEKGLLPLYERLLKQL